MKYPFIDQVPVECYGNKIRRFIDIFNENKEIIVLNAAKSATTPIKYHYEDHEYVVNTLKFLLETPIRAPSKILFRPKGKVLIGLSSNEPIIMTTVPVIAALLSGNSVFIRPSTKRKEFVEYIVTLLHKSGFDGEVQIIPTAKYIIEKYIKQSDYVLWFGSYEVCKKVALKCVEYGVDFDYESEGYDISIIDESMKKRNLEKAIEYSLESVIRHDGQICQAIRGLMIHKSCEEEVIHYISDFVKKINIGNYLDKSVNCTKTPVIEYINMDDIRFDSPPAFSSKIWVTFYSDIEDILNLLPKNPYGLSLVFFSNKSFSNILETVSCVKTSRVLINSRPEEVKPEDPWGGLKKSGSSGPSGWIEKFIDKTYIRVSGGDKFEE